MATTYTSDTLRNLFQSSFDLTQWYSFLLNFFRANELKQIPERIIGGIAEDEGYYLGSIDTTDYFRIGLFHYNILFSYVLPYFSVSFLFTILP